MPLAPLPGAVEGDGDAGKVSGQRAAVRVGECDLQVLRELRAQLRLLAAAAREHELVGRVRRRAGTARRARAGARGRERNRHRQPAEHERAFHAASPCPVGDDAAVEQRDLTRAAGGDLVVVGDHDDRRALGVELVEQGQIACAGGAVEVAGRLVGEHDRRPADERARDRDALALPARELRRARRAADRPSPTRVERLGRALAPLPHGDARVQQPVGDVLERGRVLGEEELLEHEPDAASRAARRARDRTGSRRRGR